MDRLTKQSESGMTWFIDHENNGIALEPCEMDSHNNRLAIERLADYENAEEKGLLLRLPCKVGDSIYSVIEDGLTIIELKFSLAFYVRRKTDFGKTVFLTLAEAEEKLKESGGGDGS